MTDLVTKACKALFDTQYNGPYSDQDAIDDPTLPVALHAGSFIAVLGVIREPSEAMVAAIDYDITEKALGATYPDSDGSFNEGGERIVWQAMIDALIAEAERVVVVEQRYD